MRLQPGHWWQSYCLFLHDVMHRTSMASVHHRKSGLLSGGRFAPTWSTTLDAVAALQRRGGFEDLIPHTGGAEQYSARHHIGTREIGETAPIHVGIVANTPFAIKRVVGCQRLVCVRVAC